MNQPWRIEMLGGLKVCQQDTVITRFKTHKVASLLAYLAFYNQRTHTREVLIDMLWPDSDLSQGRPSLSVALSSLRHHLEPPGVPLRSVIMTTNTDVRLNPVACTTDVAEFEALVHSANQSVTESEQIALLIRAVESYRGELLPGHYEDWSCRERDRLHSLYIQALRRLVRSLVKEHALQQAIPYAEKIVSVDPLQEEAHRDLMQLYTAVGQPSLAMRHYRELEERWQKELGELPSVTTRRLAQEIATRMERTPETATNSAPTVPKSADSPPQKERKTTLSGGMHTFLLVAQSATDKATHLPDELTGLLQKQAQAHGGQEVSGRTGTLLLAFSHAADAQSCALAILRTLVAEQSEAGRLSLALHTGEFDDAKRQRNIKRHLDALWSAAHPGQVLCSEETALFLRRSGELGISIHDLGRWRLTDSEEPVPLFEVGCPGDASVAFPLPRAERAHTPNLPMQFTRFFGREAQLQRIDTLLNSEPKARLVTLTGPGGTGKTRLAIEAALRQADNWHGAVWFVSLADLQEGGQVLETIVDALNLPRSGAVGYFALLKERLGAQPSLLVLDNLEQIMEGATTVLTQLLEGIPGLSCLATSRQKLNIAAERELAVSPLPVPAGITDPESLVRCESVRLFVDRAQTVNPDFQVTAHNAAAVAELCDQLEGLPLALELAAARAQALTPAQMLTQLQDRFAFLVSRRRDLPERHRLLRAAVDWSYQLLDPQMKRFFTSLSVFRGGWTLEAASEVGDEEQTLDALCLLQECSLIVLEESPDRSDIRFRMLQTLQAFGNEQLTSEERVLLQERHAAYFAQFASRAAEHLADAQQTVWLHRLDQDHENLRMALDYLLNTGRIAEAARMCASLSDYWERHGWLHQAVGFLQRCLTAKPPLEDPVLRHSLLSSIGWFAYLEGRYKEAQEWQERNLAECERASDLEGECIARNNLGLIAQTQGRLEDAWHYFERSLEIARQQGYTERQAARLSNLGLLAIQQARNEEARSSLEEALSLYRTAQNSYGVAACLCNLAKLAIYQGVYEEAEILVGESLKLFEVAGDRSGVAYALANLGLEKTLVGDQEGADVALRQALQICQETGLYSLAPTLLETWARNDTERKRIPTAIFALVAAERFRTDLTMPRNTFEEQVVAPLRPLLDTVQHQGELQKERVQALSLPLERLLTRILAIAAGDMK